MKFAVAVLLGLTSAVRIQGHTPALSQLKAKQGPSPSDVIDMCDANGDGMLSKKEINDCIDEYVPESDQEEAHEEVDEHFAEVDVNGDGKLSKKELKAAFSSLAQVKQGPPDDGPSPAQVIAMCDKNGDGMLSKKEIMACIKEYVPESDQSEAEDEVNEEFDNVDTNSDGEISEGELDAAFSSLAQLHSKQDPTAADIMALCDANGDGQLTKKEALDCINANMPPGPDRKEMKQDVKKGFAAADQDGSGGLDEGELEEAMDSSLAQRRHHHH